jgi:hypothetical protein
VTKFSSGTGHENPLYNDLTTLIEKYVLGKYEKAAFRIAMLIHQ